MDLRNSNGLIKELLRYNHIEAFFRKFSSEVEKCIMWSSVQVFPNQVSKNRFIRLKMLTYESPMQSYIKNRVKLWEQIEFNG